MRKFWLLFLTGFSALTVEAAPAPPADGAKVAEFRAKGVDGKTRSLSDYRSRKAIVVVFIGTECPISNLYLLTLTDLQQKYADKGVQFLTVNSNDFDTFADVVAHAKDHPVPFPILKDDEEHSVAVALGGLRTPEAFLLDSERVIRYHGRVDDQYGFRYRRASPSKTELKDALDELLAGKPVTVTKTDVEGCFIGRTKKGTNRPSK